MELTYLARSTVRIKTGTATILLDPLPPKTLPAQGPQVADILVHSDRKTPLSALLPKEGEPQEVGNPGEYELKEVRLLGLKTLSSTIFRIDCEGLSVLALGPLKEPLSPELIEEIGHIDVLLLPVGGYDALSATAASELATEIEPRIICPIRYKLPLLQDYAPLEEFGALLGNQSSWDIVPKLSLNSTNVASYQEKVVVLEPKVGK